MQLVNRHAVNVFRWAELDAMEELRNEPHAENGVLVFDRYDELMEIIRVARAGQAAEL